MNSPGAGRKRIVHYPETNQQERFLDYLKRLGAKEEIEFGYINSGVLLIDAQQWREQNVSRDFIRLIENQEFVHAPDQDMINVYFDGKIKLLDPTWNFQTSLFNVITTPQVDDWMQRNPSFYQGLKKCENEPAIIHFVYFKPWIRKEKKTKFDFKFIQSSFLAFGLSHIFFKHLIIYLKKSTRRNNQLPKRL